MRVDSIRFGKRGGLALITVVLVLAGLLLLCTPFLLTARNADQSSQQIFHRAEAKIALDNASLHARALLERSHPSLDHSLYSDSLEELRVSNLFAGDFLDANDVKGIMWDVRTADVAGKIDLGSAPPQLLGAMMGNVTRLVVAIAADAEEIPLASVQGLDPTGYVWVGGELIKYTGIDGNQLIGLERGHGALFNADDEPLPGPLPPTEHGVGATVIDQRAYAPVEWRLFDGDSRTFDSLEQLEESNQFTSLESPLRAEHFDSLMRMGSVFGGVGAGARWQRAARMTSAGARETTGTIRVDSARWFNAGSTILIKSGDFSELAVVRGVGGGGTVQLDRGLSGNYNAFEAEVFVLSRRPVNINTATPEVIEALLENLKLRDRNQRITAAEARTLAGIIVESRPFDGFEDFLRRVVLPSAGLEPLPSDAPVMPDAFAQSGDRMAGIIDNYDALALYRNALNANDFQLEYSTMPFSFTSNNVYDITARTVINAKSGVERANAIREETQVVIPQEELMHVWGTQEDYEMLLRLGREAPFWMTGPEATSRSDNQGQAQPPSRLWAQMGTLDGHTYLGSAAADSTPDSKPDVDHVFGNKDPNGFVQLLSHPVNDQADPDLTGHVIHFTHESRRLEGRYLPDESITYSTDDPILEWNDGSSGLGLMRGFNFSFWIKPTSHSPSTLLDVSGSSQEVDRVALSFDQGDLVLRSYSAGGDHVDSTGNSQLAQFEELSEVRYSLAPSNDGPGLPVDTWSHIEIDVRGSRPDQMMMLVNGLALGVRTLGLTSLSSSVGENDTLLPVDSVEGFPPIGVARIGNELVEYRLQGNALETSYVENGPDAGFGGRNARTRWSNGDAPGISTPSGAPLNIAGNKPHPQGAAVEIYGYAQQLASDIPAGEGTLAAALGSFRVGMVTGTVGGPTNGEQINVVAGFGMLPVGTGIRAQSTQVEELVISNAEDPSADATPVMNAFNPQGGYALLMQGQLLEVTDAGEPVGGWSVIRYSGWTDNRIQVAAWGTDVNELQNLQGMTANQLAVGGGARSFVTRWTASFQRRGPINDLHDWRLFIIPISVPVSGNSSAFLPADSANPQFAQITEASLGENTEWICYNEIGSSGGIQQLIRDDPRALTAARLAAVGALTQPDFEDPDPSMGSGPPNQMAGPEFMPRASSAPAAPIARTLPAIGSEWQPILGEPEDLDPAPEGLPITRAVREAFQFRGVMGTYPHDHAIGVPIRPVFHLQGGGINAGAPGRYDPVFLFEADPSHIGWPVSISRSFLPGSETYTVHNWELDPSGDIIARKSQGTTVTTLADLDVNDWYVALNGPAPAAVSGSALSGVTGTVDDSRLMARMTRFPSGERPRDGVQAVIGGSSSGGQVAAAYVDELVFGATQFSMSGGEAFRAGQSVMIEGLPDNNGQEVIHVGDTSIRIASGMHSSSYKYLGDYDPDGGLVRIGTEILAYESVDENEGTITVAQNGRALLGTDQGEHEAGCTVTFLDGLRAAILTTGIGAGDADIFVQSTDNFPSEGTLLIDGELIHYTRLVQNNGFGMPRGSSMPGMMDERGSGIFRGRYGTQPESHAAGTPAIFFPMRYWDRWEPQVDGPELSYFGFELSQPAAFWRGFSWTEEAPVHPGIRLGVLMRTDESIPWDSDPEITDGLELFYENGRDTNMTPISAQSDRVQWRVFAEYTQEAFGIFGQQSWGRGHGWRTTPGLTSFLVEYLGPAMTLRSVDR
ncbi:MAG: hypothetical protein ACI8X5_000042 [Planctomycetota bacterium]|jgi:hypothetical protein